MWPVVVLLYLESGGFLAAHECGAAHNQLSFPPFCQKPCEGTVFKNLSFLNSLIYHVKPKADIPANLKFLNC